MSAEERGRVAITNTFGAGEWGLGYALVFNATQSDIDQEGFAPKNIVLG